MEPTGNRISCMHNLFSKKKKTLTRIFGKQGVAPSFRENVRRHVTEVEEDHMDVDDVAPTGRGML